jgi:hypothetical protein
MTETLSPLAAHAVTNAMSVPCEHMTDIHQTNFAWKFVRTELVRFKKRDVLRGLTKIFTEKKTQERCVQRRYT